MFKLFFLFAFIFNFYAFAQEKKDGHIINTNGQPVPFASIQIYRGSDTEVIRSFVSDKNGMFNLQGLNDTLYLIKVSAIGYLNSSSRLKIKNGDLKIVLAEEATSLQEVKIQSKKKLIERKIDRTVFNVESSTSSIGANSLEILGKIPGVRVQDEKISLAGKNTVLVMLDDKLIQLSGSGLSSLLRGIPSDNISKIEVITNPPSKYDAQGNSGIINIVTKKNLVNGYNGSIRITDKVATYNYLDMGANLNYKSNKISLSGSAAIGNGPLNIIQDNNIYYEKQTWIQKSKRKNYIDNKNASFGIDYKITSKITIGASYLYSGSNPDMYENISNDILNINNTRDSLLITNASTRRAKKYNNVNAHLITKFDTIGTSLSLNFDYLNYKDINNRDFSTQTFIGQRQDLIKAESASTTANQNLDIYTFKSDLEIPNKFIPLSVGGKLSFIKNSSGTAFFNLKNGENVIDPLQLNRFSYTENIQALYISGKKSFGKFEFQAGFRGELTETKGVSEIGNQVISNNYFKLFPTFYSTYTPNENNVFGINYGKRIGRPNYEYLNPFKWFTSPYTYYEGNPFLMPSYTNNIELSHTYKNFLTSNLYLNFTNNEIDQIAITNENSIAYQYRNLVNIYSYGIIESVTLTPFKWLESYNQLQPYYTIIKSKSDLTVPRQSSLSAYFSSDNTFLIAKKTLTSVNLGFWYQLPEVSGIYKFEGYGNISIGFKTTFLHKKIVAGVNMTDVFKMQIQNYTGTTYGITQSFRNYNDNRQVNFSLSFKFGNDKYKVKSLKGGNTEEKNRL